MGDTLISPIVASYLLYLAVTYTLIRTYLDKPDNLHFNGDYRKKLNNTSVNFTDIFKI